MRQSQERFDMWPNSSLLVRQLEYSVHAMPWIRMVGEMPEPGQYAMRDQLKQWQVTATYEGSFTYKGKPSYQAALARQLHAAGLPGWIDADRSRTQPGRRGVQTDEHGCDAVHGPAWDISQQFDNIPSG